MIRLRLIGKGWQQPGDLWVRPEAVESIRSLPDGTEVMLHSLVFLVSEPAEDLAAIIEAAIRQRGSKR